MQRHYNVLTGWMLVVHNIYFLLFATNATETAFSPLSWDYEINFNQKKKKKF